MLTEKKSGTVVIYHGKCADGFAAALCAWLVYGDSAQYVACTQFGVLPDVKLDGKDVFILDFSFEPELLVQMEAQAKSITLLDHHVTAQRNLKGHCLSCAGKIHFDLSRSGAMLAWEHFHAGNPAPDLIRFVQDGDLWQWKVSGSENFLAWLHTQPHDFHVWSQAMAMQGEELAAVIELGRVLRAQFLGLCQKMAESARPVTVCGQAGLMVNADHIFAGQLGSLLSQKSGSFALVWSVDETERLSFSLRSGKNFNVEVMAAKFGGGGHAQAAGFRLPIARITDVTSGELNP